jgi:hypothetical protein
VLASHRAVHHRGARLLGDEPGCTHCDGAIDYRYFRLEQIDIANRLRDEILDLKWVADVKSLDGLNIRNRWLDIHANCKVMPGCKFEERFPDFSESDDNNISFGFHELCASCEKIADLNSSIAVLYNRLVPNVVNNPDSPLLTSESPS